MSLNHAIRQQVRERAQYLCEYCHSCEETSAAQFEIDHIHPKSLGGSDELMNLALACQRCNSYRYNFVTGMDPETQQMQSLFNPRQQVWGEHFAWTVDGLRIVGQTPIGRATIERLDLNDDRHNASAIIKARTFWVRGGWHPPLADPVVKMRN